uniref:Putative secreted protein n=1 Tax=Anopheles triannulatus TaxID=58253 RepID=A0A2M4B1P4_9DIPT
MRKRMKPTNRTWLLLGGICPPAAVPVILPRQAQAIPVLVIPATVKQNQDVLHAKRRKIHLHRSLPPV